MSPADIEAFEDQDYADDAVAVRRWDDLGKQAEMPTLPLAHFMAVLERCAAAQSSSVL
jgi:predicted HD phosphohydrolase